MENLPVDLNENAAISSFSSPMVLQSKKLIERAPELKMPSAPVLGTDLEEFHEKVTRMLEKACDSNDAISSLGGELEAKLKKLERISKKELLHSQMLLENIQIPKALKHKKRKHERNLEEVPERETGMLEEKKACDSNDAISSLVGELEAKLKKLERISKKILLHSLMLLENIQIPKALKHKKRKHERNLEEVCERETRMLEEENVISDKI